jgi:chorismate mutase
MVLAQTFKNCSEVNRTYRWGVAKSIAAAKMQKNYPINNPLVSEAIYKSIAKMDRDKDGTACEK